MNVRKLLPLHLLLMIMISVSAGTLLAAKPMAPAPVSRAERAFNLIKSMYTLEYLDGENGKYRKATLLQKITRQPGRALATAAVYGLSFWSLKQVYHAADKHGLFDGVRAQAAKERFESGLQAYREQQRTIYKQQKRQPQDNQIDKNPRVNGPDKGIMPLNNVRIANPLPGYQLAIPGIPDLPGFYHMQSNMPGRLQRDEDGDRIAGPCGIHAAWNMAQVESRTLGRQITEQDFAGALHAAIPNLRGKDGLNNTEVENIGAQLGLAPMRVFGFDRDGNIILFGRAAHNFIEAANQELARVAQEFRRTQGARVAHFLCGIPGHWIAISVTRNAAGEQAMYLYDNMNDQAGSINHMRRHIENIYNRFFQMN